MSKKKFEINTVSDYSFKNPEEKYHGLHKNIKQLFSTLIIGNVSRAPNQHISDLKNLRFQKFIFDFRYQH